MISFSPNKSDGQSTAQLRENQYFHHDDSEVLKKTFLLLFAESPDGKYILIVSSFFFVTSTMKILTPDCCQKIQIS